METTRSAIISLLTVESGQPRRALYPFPLSHKWGYLPDRRDSQAIAFEDRDVRQLYIEGILEFVNDERGLRCAVLNQPQRSRTLPRVAGAAIDTHAETPRREDAVATQPNEQQIRQLLVGGGSTFTELESAGKAGGGRVYCFDELLSLSPERAEPAPPLVFIHVPKAGGTTVNSILMKNFRYRLDSYGASFFPRYYPDEFVSLVGAPSPDDTRRPVFFTGHIDIENDVFRHMPVAYVAITMLRDPVQRITSHYRGESTLPDSPISNEMRSGKLTLVDFFRRLYPSYQRQYQIFAPKSYNIGEALQNLENRVSFFGLQERFDEFVVLLSDLLGLPNVAHIPLNKTSDDASPVAASQIEELRGLLADDVAFYQSAQQLYGQRIAKMRVQLGDRVEKVRQTNQHYLTHRAGRKHIWTRFYA